MPESRMHTRFTPSAAQARYLPFGSFMAFIGLEEFLKYLLVRGFITLSPTTLLLYLYPIKVMFVLGLLWYFRGYYTELSWSDMKKPGATLLSLSGGVLVFLLWIQLDRFMLNAGATSGYNPYLLPDAVQIPMIIVRIFGAVVLVPIMEELFWRSFLIRYLVDADFEKVAIGKYTVGSFVATVVLFGFEHHLIVAGMVAGALYNLLIYRTKSLTQVILAHALTNLLLALYVLKTGRWEFW